MKGRQYSSRGLEKAFICILSPNYMLRDYMKMNYRIFENDAKYIPQFVVEHVDSKRNIALRILRRLLEEPVSYTELKRILEKEDEDGDKEEVTENILKEKVKLILPDVSDFDLCITDQINFSEHDRQIEREIYYQIIDEKVRKEFQKQFSRAVYIDETGEVRHISKMILGEHLDQKYEKGQFVVFDGKYFEITGKTMYNNAQALQVKRASDQICGRKYYRICRKYQICLSPETCSAKGKSSGHIIVDNQYLRIEGMPVELKVKNIRYLEMNSWNNIKEAKKVELSGKGIEESEFDRVYAQKHVLGVKLGNREPKAVLLMAAFLKESFCTLYPQFYHLLDVAIDYNGEINGFLNEELKNVIAQIELQDSRADNAWTDDKQDTGDADGTALANIKKEIDFYIIEDSREDMGLLHSIERNILKIVDMMQDYMVWSKQSGRNYFKYDGK